MTYGGSDGSAERSGLSDQGRSAVVVLFVLTLFGVALGGSFFAGIHLERETAKPLIVSVGKIKQERDALLEQVAELKQQSIVMERSHQIDHEASRILSEQLKAAQDKRLAIEKESSFLRRLIREGGGGILQAKDFKLKEGGDPGEFAYSFTIRQLIGDFGESVGDVEVKLSGKQAGEEIVVPLRELAGSKPRSHKLKLKHFQTFEGSVQVPEDFEPENLVVEIKPKTANLIPGSETFPWSVEAKPRWHTDRDPVE